MALSLTFHGAAGMVTGSKHLLEVNPGSGAGASSTRVLLDCGMFQGEGARSDELNRRFGFDPKSIDVLVLSHAHIDHSGLIPRLVAEGFKGIIWSTPATRDLCAIMLEDSARIQEYDFAFDVKRARERGRALEHPEPLYTVDQVRPALALFQCMDYNETRTIAPGVSFTFRDAGHILGSAWVQLSIDDGGKVTRLSFSGDVGRYVDRLLPDPWGLRDCDVLVMESTYGDRDHPEATEAQDAFLGHVQRVCVEQHGKLLIPAFSIGKTQELLYSLNSLSNAGRLPRVPVYVDSPLSISATGIYRQHSQLLQDDVRAELSKDPDLFTFPGVEFIRKPEHSKALNARTEPCIIIAASGMMEAGRIRHHLRHGLPDPKNGVLVVGFCAPGTLGDDLLRGDKEVRIFGDPVPVNAGIFRMESYSAHAGQSELLRWVGAVRPKRSFLVHGVDQGLNGLKGKLEEQGLTGVGIPHLGERAML